MILKCALCNEEIENYRKHFNNFDIDETRSVAICSECIQKFLMWQQKNYAALFPTKTAKKFLKKWEK